MQLHTIVSPLIQPAVTTENLPEFEFTFDNVVTEVEASNSYQWVTVTFELTELFGASLAFPGAPPPRVTLAPASAQVTILDDDGQC